MQNKITLSILFIYIVAIFSSCAIVGGIFQAGTGFGIILLVASFSLIVFLIKKLGEHKDVR